MGTGGWQSGPLRVGYLALAVAVAGVIVMSSGSTPWVLAAGVIMWLGVAVVTLTGLFWAGTSYPSRDPGFGRCGSCSSTTPSTPCRRPCGPDSCRRRGCIRRRPTSKGPTRSCVNEGRLTRSEPPACHQARYG